MHRSGDSARLRWGRVQIDSGGCVDHCGDLWGRCCCCCAGHGVLGPCGDPPLAGPEGGSLRTRRSQERHPATPREGERGPVVPAHEALANNREAPRCRCPSVPSVPSVPSAPVLWVQAPHGGDVASCAIVQPWATENGRCDCGAGCCVVVATTHGVLARHGCTFGDAMLSQRAECHPRLLPPNPPHPVTNPQSGLLDTRSRDGDGARRVGDGADADGACTEELEGGHGGLDGRSGGSGRSRRCWQSRPQTRGTTTTNRSSLTCDR